jgi:hypothetical protein
VCVGGGWGGGVVVGAITVLERWPPQLSLPQPPFQPIVAGSGPVLGPSAASNGDWSPTPPIAGDYHYLNGG